MRFKAINVKECIHLIIWQHDIVSARKREKKSNIDKEDEIKLTAQ